MVSALFIISIALGLGWLVWEISQQSNPDHLRRRSQPFNPQVKEALEGMMALLFVLGFGALIIWGGWLLWQAFAKFRQENPEIVGFWIAVVCSLLAALAQMSRSSPQNHPETSSTQAYQPATAPQEGQWATSPPPASRSNNSKPKPKPKTVVSKPSPDRHPSRKSANYRPTEAPRNGQWATSPPPVFRNPNSKLKLKTKLKTVASKPSSDRHPPRKPPSEFQTILQDLRATHYNRSEAWRWDEAHRILAERQRANQQSGHPRELELIKLLYGDKDQAHRLIQQAGGNVDRAIEQLIQDRAS